MSTSIRVTLGGLFSLLAVLPWATEAPESPAGPGGGASEPAFHAIFFAEDPLPAYRGGVPGLEATNPRSRGERRLDPRSPASRAYLAWLEGRQDAHLEAIGRALGRTPEVVHRYRAGGNGVITRLTPQEAVVVSALPGVVRVAANRWVELATDRTVEMIGTFGIWDGSASGGVPTQGEGVIVGIIDTGVNQDSPSFSDAPLDGHVYTNPLGPGGKVGWCAPGNPDFSPEWVCNDKLIGMWDFFQMVNPLEDDGPLDDNGHGSHTASTAAGNHVDLNGDGIIDLSGVAPHANLITYDACGSGCFSLSLQASVDQAILDGVDVINFSITGGTDPWHPDDIDAFFLNAVASGIFVAASAGNFGAPSTTLHLGPWMMTVAASTHDRETFENAVVNLSGPAPRPADMIGQSRTLGYGPAPVVHARGFDNGDVDPGICEMEFPAATWNGEIVVCDRGSGGIPRLMKGQNVLKGGAGGFILANNVDGLTNLVDDLHSLPAVHLGATGGDELRAWLESGSGHMATITPGTQILGGRSDVMADFSSQGPNPAFDVVKPDVTNPGSDVFAAYSNLRIAFGLSTPFEGLAYHTLSGTSMSSPHTAGSAALLRALHPDWTPPEIKSALMTTASRDVQKALSGTPADPFDMGAGRVDLSQAGRAGLVLDETQANFLAAEPVAGGGDPKTLNLASFADSDCRGLCTWTRTLKGTASTAVGWTASGSGPSWMQFSFSEPSFTLAPGASQALTVSVSFFDPSIPVGDWQFAEVILTPDDPDVPEVRMPVAIIPREFPIVLFESASVEDPLGNGDGALDPDEVITLSVVLRNDGIGGAVNVVGKLSTSTPGVTILDDEASWISIFPLDTRPSSTPHFLVHVDGSVPCESFIDFDLEVTSTEKFNLSFQVPVGTDVALRSNPLSGDTPLAIPDNRVQGVTSTLAVAEPFAIFDAEVTIDITHGNIGDLEVDLTSPAGTTVRLHDRSGEGAADLVTSYPTLVPADGPGSVADLLGESSDGVWTLLVADRGHDIVGTLNSWSLSLTGPPAFTCAPAPCVVLADASATPNPACEGDAVTVDASATAEYGGICSGVVEYRFELGGALLQDWSPDPDIVVTPTATTAYTVWARDQGTLVEDIVFPPVTVHPVPPLSIAQAPDPMCVELPVELDAGDQFSSYTWRDDIGQVVGAAQLLTLDDSSCGRIYTVDTLTPDACPSFASHALACVSCAPDEVSPAGAAVPFRFGIDAAGTVEFELLADPGVVYHLYGAETIEQIQAADWAYKICDLAGGALGTWSPVDATMARWTPLLPGILFEGYWVVVAERTDLALEGLFGVSTGGVSRPPDADGVGAILHLGCP